MRFVYYELISTILCVFDNIVSLILVMSFVYYELTSAILWAFYNIVSLILEIFPDYSLVGVIILSIFQ